ncbi:3-hydroxyacyl-CoA dehydrogenase [Variovorax paradoxus]|jgi:NAD(P)-dependent dehydrogenase (short-subunit alcohol dehydrogenase family)|uniref:SDR family NAD(P)-dependent oxidoreductase n=1 Tax=Variovorax TaxID=34072 RepID=UPI0006E722DA|nr:SDR family NAD(P)-dependent oxidoreductase [Variovorax sp. CY25R-8]KPU93010.1 3-hydroxyacyl-CoA dehydrogenase [Variovorax paradoxus]KPU94963.1 3-hydroxyacyl-CoA dehydrogenase [Variovorax paradoxus]KPU96149.1 3-hydroxyacyl-CoA dehydrogenase [Variovorax paradoxus]KPV15725.1 3-hydroxyacyl-CoA dehydrogenase [Variovorax paradoxus]KPV30021.1 3-hydroxyacyl-CoA dehydrogenase [Variovorax paradoxus]
MQANSLSGRHALVTGAARGIGAEIARTLAAEGAVLTLLGRDREALQRVADTLPAAASHRVVAADVADPAAVQQAFAQARAALGPLAILVNNAGAAESAPFLKTSVELWQRMLSVNLTGSFLCTQAALPDMLEAGWGRIVNIASTAGQKGYAYVAAYTAAKHGVIGLTRSLALEVARKGVTVNAVCPGYTDTDILRNSVANVVGKTGRSEADALAEFSSVNPQRRIVQPSEVADAVRWLCGEGAASVNGQSISVSGGEVT